MNKFEDELRQALRSLEPPAGFAERVLARAAEGERTKARCSASWLALFHLSAVRWGAVGALCATLLAGGAVYRHEQQRARGEEAKRQLMLALRITANELQTVRARVREISSQEPTRE